VFYIDGDDAAPQDAPTIKAFRDETGIDIDYTVDVDDNASFTATVQPKLEQGEAIGYDLVVLTSWMCDRWIQKGWAAELDDSKLPNKSNLLSRMADPAWDPGRKYTLPYAEGQVGIAYYPDEVGFEIKDVKDLLDPRIKGKVTILSEMRDSLGMFMLSEGIDPSTASVEEAKEALVLIEEARDKGQFRKITGNSYTDDLGARDAVAAIAWSGDVVALQAENPDLVWVAPEAGQVSFVDTMLIPANAVNAEQAHAWMNFLYDPTVSGPLFEFISYVSPVEGAADNMSDDARSNLLINPPADAKIVEFRTLTETEADDLENAFAQATQL
jgi:spermidine/putrescine transport system substrate-binding protein